jgi:curved DNA-binding protein CbpA
MSTPYEDLGVPATATKDEIKAAYRKQAQVLHPDKGGDTEEFQKLASAYALLSDDAERRQYDQTGQRPRAGGDNQLAELAQLLASVIDQASDVATLDVVGSMRAKLKEEIAANQQRKREVTAAIEKRRKVASRLKAKAGKDNLLADCMQADINTGEELLALLEQRIVKVWALIDRVDDYTYLTDPAAPQYTTYNPHLGTASTGHFF